MLSIYWNMLYIGSSLIWHIDLIWHFIYWSVFQSCLCKFQSSYFIQSWFLFCCFVRFSVITLEILLVASILILIFQQKNSQMQHSSFLDNYLQGIWQDFGTSHLRLPIDVIYPGHRGINRDFECSLFSKSSKNIRSSEFWI